MNDKQESDAYIEHLAKVNESNAVVAMEDIRNTDGVVILKQGSRVSDEVVDRLLRFKLLRAIEDSVGLDSMLSGEQLYSDIKVLCDDYVGGSELYQSANIDEELNQRCQLIDQYQPLAQKLTVHRSQYSERYKRSQMCAWMSLYLAKQLELDEGQRQSIFLAALCHDCGMLHLPQDVLKKKSELTPEEWRTLQCHVVIGEKIMVGVGLDKRAARAVLEHHERCNGSGYPMGKLAEELSLEGQIIAMSNMMLAIYHKRLQPRGRSFADLVPILQLNSELHFYQVYDVTVRWLRSAFADRDDVIPLDLDFHQQLQHLDRCQTQFTAELVVIADILQVVETKPDHRQLKAVVACKRQLDKVIDSSGLLTKEYLQLLRDGDCYSLALCAELDQVSLMMDELRWQLNHIKRILRGIRDYEAEVPAGVVASITRGLQELQPA